MPCSLLPFGEPNERCPWGPASRKPRPFNVSELAWPPCGYARNINGSLWQFRKQTMVSISKQLTPAYLGITQRPAATRCRSGHDSQIGRDTDHRVMRSLEGQCATQ